MTATTTEDELKPLRDAWNEASRIAAKIAAECTRIHYLIGHQKPRGKRLGRMTRHYAELCAKCLVAEEAQAAAWAAYAEPAGLRDWARRRFSAEEITG